MKNTLNKGFRQIIYQYPEGATPLDPDEKEGLKIKHITLLKELDQFEQANIIHGKKWMMKYKKQDIISEIFIKTLHKKLFGDVWEWAGEYRKTNKNIGVDKYEIPIYLKQLIGDTDYWIKHKTYHPLELAIRFHQRLVAIHLFPNGNGRHARIMADTILIKLYNLKPIDWVRKNKFQNIKERRASYILALREADKGNYQPLLDFVDL